MYKPTKFYDQQSANNQCELGDFVIDDYTKDGGPGVVQLLCSFYHDYFRAQVILGDLRKKFSRERSGQSVSLLNHLTQGLLPWNS